MRYRYLDRQSAAKEPVVRDVETTKIIAELHIHHETNIPYIILSVFWNEHDIDRPHQPEPRSTQIVLPKDVIAQSDLLACLQAMGAKLTF